MNLSIIIPVYNAERYLQECVDSIVKELPNMEETEVLLLDDGSKDRSLQICKELQTKSACIRVYHHDNHGVSYTRNRGIQEASGKYIMFVDADDAMCAGWFKYVQQEFQNENDVVYFGANVSHNPSKEDMVDGIFGIPCDKNVGLITSPCSKLYKTALLTANDTTFDECLINGEDAIFNLQVINASKQYKFVKQSIYQYRIYSESSTKRYNSKFYKSNLKYLQKASGILGEMNWISSEKKREYLAHSFYYSVYLMFFLISKIDDPKYKKQELKLFQTKEMQKLYQKFSGHHDRWLYDVFVGMASHGWTRMGNFAMNMLNATRKKVKKEMFWERI